MTVVEREEDPIDTGAYVVAVSASAEHTFAKINRRSIRLVEDRGVEGDAHFGASIKHRSRVAQDPSRPNLRQVHLIHSELFDELRTKGFEVHPGEIGENITTRGIDLLGLPTGALLHIGRATIEITGLRNPCHQLDRFQDGLMAATLDHDAAGTPIRKAGVMGVVRTGGEIAPGDPIDAVLPAGIHRPLEKV
jgi:hypothetical protein